MEVVDPVKILNETGRMKVKHLEVIAISAKLDLLDGVREKIAVRMAKGYRIL